MFKYNGFGNVLEIDGLGANSLSFTSTENLTYNDDVVAYDLSRPISNLADNDFIMYSFLERMARQFYNKNGVFQSSLGTALSFSTSANTKTINFGTLGYKTFVTISPGIAGFGYTRARQNGFIVVNKPEIEIAERQIATLLSLRPEDDLEYVKIKYSFDTNRYKMRIVKVNSGGTPITYDFLNTAEYPTSTFEDDDGSGFTTLAETISLMYTDTTTTPLKSALLNDFYYKNTPENLASLVCEPTFYFTANGTYHLKIDANGRIVCNTDAASSSEFPLYTFTLLNPNTSNTTFSNIIDNRVFYVDNEIYTKKIDFNTTAESDDYNQIYSEVSGSDTIMHHRIGRDTADKFVFEYYNGSSTFPILEMKGDISSTFYKDVSILGNTVLGDSVANDTLTLNSTLVSDLVFNDENRTIKLGGNSGSNTTRTLTLTNSGSGMVNLTVEGDITVSNGNLITGNATSTLFNTIATNLTIGGVATTLSIGNATGIQAITIGNGVDTTTAQTITLGRASNANSVVNIVGTTPSTSSSTGALKVTGGVGIGEKLFVANDFTVNIDKFVVASSTGNLTTKGNIVLDGDITVKGGDILTTVTTGTFNIFPDTLTGTLNIGTLATAITLGSNPSSTGTISLGKATSSGYTEILNTTVASSTTSGALRVAGGVGIAGKLYVGSDFAVSNTFTVAASTGNTVISGTLNVNGASINTTGSLGVTGAATIGGTLGVTGIVSTSSGVFRTATNNVSSYLFDTTTTDVNIAQLSPDIKIGNASTLTQNIYIGNSTDNLTVQTINIGRETNTLSGSYVRIALGAEAISSSTGALRVVGGVGIGKKLYVGGDFAVSNTFTVASSTGNTVITGDLAVNGGDITSTASTLNISVAKDGQTIRMAYPDVSSSVVIQSTKTATAYDTAALVVSGGIGANGKIIANNDLVTNNGIVTTSNSIATLFNENPTTSLTIATYAQTLNIGTNPAGNQVINIGSTNISYNQTINIGTSISTAAQIINIGKTSNTASSFNILNSTTSSSTSTGALVVTGGVGIGGALNVGGNAAITGTTTLSNTLNVNADTLSTNKTTFNLINTTTNTVNFAGASTTMVIGASSPGTTTFKNTTDATSSTASIILEGGLLVKQKAYVTGVATFASTVGITGALTLTDDLAVNGGDITSTAGIFNLINQPGIINFAGASSTLNIGNSTGTQTITIGNGADTSTTQTITLGRANNANTSVNIVGTKVSSSTSTGALVVTGGVGIGGALNVGGIISGSGNVNVAGTLNVNGAAIESDDPTFNLLSNATVTTLNIGHSASAVSIGTTGGTTTIRSTLASTSGITGALVVSGGAGIGGALNVSGTISGGGTVNVAGTLTVNGANLTSGNATFNLLDNSSVSTAINFGRNAASIVMGSSGSSASVTVQSTKAGTAYNSAALVVAGGLGIAGSVVGNSNLTIAGDTTLAGDLAINGGDLTTTITSGSFNLLNTGLIGTLNIGQATGTLNLGKTAVNIGNASSLTTIGNDLYVTGNQVRIASKYEFNYDSTTNTLDLVYVG